MSIEVGLQKCHKYIFVELCININAISYIFIILSVLGVGLFPQWSLGGGAAVPQWWMNTTRMYTTKLSVHNINDNKYKNTTFLFLSRIILSKYFSKKLIKKNDFKTDNTKT